MVLGWSQGCFLRMTSDIMVISLRIAWNEPRKVSISIPYVLCSLSKQEVFAPTSCWVTFDPAESSILPGRTCCVLTLVNIIPKFPKKNHKFLYELSSKFSRFYVSICMVIKKCKVSLILCGLRNGVCEDLPPNLITVAEIFCLESGPVFCGGTTGA